ncbi:MAG: SMI1/KNR4 family protein [Endozoicomonas sp. (ex Botrylloides leachii)]|nr:SMI1/KNR4 family protein [Endozoicomonas sp. (ex Botrylloides leachii)]
MEDIIEALRENALDVPTSIPLPNEDDLVNVEEEILIPLPYDLREFLLQVSDVVYGSLEPVTITDPHAHTHLPEVASQAWSIFVPRHLIPICQEGNSYYCISADGEICHWSQEGQSEQTWSSIWQWASNVWLQS